MKAKVDWYEFVYQTQDPLGAVGQGDYSRLNEHINSTPARPPGIYKPFSEWDVFPGRGIWSLRLQNPDTKVSISVSDKRGGFKMELPGEACDHAREYGNLTDLIVSTRDWCSRIDLAIDINTGNLEPIEFRAYAYAATQSASKRLKSSSESHSGAGDTYYLGSWNSDRFARVYHFNPPHPRSEFVRFEAVYKGKYAKTLLKNWDGFSTETLVKSAHDTYKWEVQEIKNWDAAAFDVTVPRSDKSNGAQIRWLLTVCIPALRKALESGAVSYEYVFDHLTDNTFK